MDMFKRIANSILFVAVVSVWVTPCFSKADSNVLATVNDVPIYASDLAKLTSKYKEKTNKKQVPLEDQEQLLKNLIRRHLVAQLKPVQELRKRPDIVQKVRAYEEELIVSSFVQENIQKRVSVSDEEIKAYYQENKDKFSSNAKIRASHILLRTREEAEKVLSKLHEGGDFAQLAREYSIDLPMALEGGSMGIIEQGRTLPILEKTLFSLDVGEMSDVVKTDFGYHIIRVDEIMPVTVRSLKEVRNAIKAHLTQEKASETLDEMMKELEGDADIHVFEARLQDFGGNKR